MAWRRNNYSQCDVPEPNTGFVAVAAGGWQSLGLLSGDCNTNWIPDACDIDCGTSGGLCDVPGCGLGEDCNSNGVPDDCQCIYDIDGDGLINPYDSNLVMASLGWFVGGGYPLCDTCDVDGNGVVNPYDSNAVMAHFGLCP